ncbi:AAA family ATPase [uncultured Microbacterium sp.]|uniref:AAA family ATPase n=1 Tax=uncultured Microbacterium sp. TaxID=191216 RepID=UPI0035C9E67D
MVDAGELIGRQAEVERIAGVIAGLPASGDALLVTGEAGIGKSSLLACSERLARQRNVVVLSAVASEAEVHLPFATLHSLLHSVETQRLRLQPRLRAALDAAIGLGDEAPSDVFLVGLAVLELLSELGQGRGVLVTVDDTQWMDYSTAQVLGFVSRRVRADPIAIVFVKRSGWSSPLDEAHLSTLHIGSLSDEDAEALLVSHRRELDAAGRRRILELAQGHPLALLELAASGNPSDDAEDRIHLGDRLRESFAVRWAGLSPAANAALLVVTVSDGAPIEEVLAAADHLVDAQDASIGVWEELAATGAVRIDDGHIRFRHPLIRSAVMATVSAQELRAAHRSLGATLGAPQRAAWHLAAAATGADEHAAEALDEVAAHARAGGDVALEHRALARASELSENPARRSRRLLRAAQTAVDLNRPGVARSLAAQLDATALGPIDSARFALLRDSLDATAHSQSRVDRLVSHARAVVAAHPDLAVSLLIAAGTHLTAASFTLEADSATDVTRALAAHLGADDPRVVAVLAVVDPQTNATLVRERLSHIDFDAFDERDELLVNATAFVLDADPTLARLQAAAIDRFRARGQLRAVASLRVVHTWTAIALADWPEAMLAAEEGIRLAQETGSAQWESGSVIALAMIAAFRGDEEGAAAAITAAETLAATKGAQNVLTGVQLTRGVDHIARGEFDEATSALKRSCDPDDPSFHPVQSPWCLGDLAQAAYHCGRLDEIRPIMASFGTARTSSPWHRMASEYAEPFLRTDPAGVEAAFLTAIAGRVSRWPTYRARMLIEYGSWLRRRRRGDEAKDRLRTGRDQADAYGLHPWSMLARHELRAMGEESARAHVAAWERLSPQELHVAQLAAAGLSNREIGERLFLSHRTVGSHLYRIFPKLGITNRAQLAAVIEQPERRPRAQRSA